MTLIRSVACKGQDHYTLLAGMTTVRRCCAERSLSVSVVDHVSCPDTYILYAILSNSVHQALSG